MQSNPVVVDGVLYATTPTLKVVALDAATGREIWTVRSERRRGAAARASAIAASRVHNDRVFVSYRNLLYALDKTTGQPIAAVRRRTAASICAKASACRPSAPASARARRASIFEDLLIMGSSVPETLPGTPGHIRAFDVNTGKLRWIFHTIPQPGEFGYDTLAEGRLQADLAAPTRGPASRSTRRSAMVFAATGSASFDFYGVNRHGDNLFADCVLALDARTGTRIWHFQGIQPRRVGLRLPRRAEPRHGDARRPQASRRSRRSPSSATSTSSIDAPASRCSRSQQRKVPPSDDRRRAAGRAPAVSGEAAAVHAAGPDRGHAHQRGRRRRTRRCWSGSARCGAGMFAPPTERGHRSSFPASTAAPNGAARRSIPTARCSTSTRTRCRGSSG